MNAFRTQSDFDASFNRAARDYENQTDDSRFETEDDFDAEADENDTLESDYEPNVEFWDNPDELD